MRHLKRHNHTRKPVDDVTGPSRALHTHSTSSTTTPERISHSLPKLANRTDYQFLQQHVPAIPSNLNLAGHASANAATDEASFDPIFQLTWPDSEALLQSLLGTDFDVLQPPTGLLSSQSVFSNDQQLNVEPKSPWLNEEDRENGDHSGNQAIRNLTRIITTLVRGIPFQFHICFCGQEPGALLISFKSADVTSQAEFTGLTTVFLDGCLHMFFTNFVPTFPIVHRPTFIFREWTHPLLLNAIALGSRFMFQKESSLKVGSQLVVLLRTVLTKPSV